jgi:hypothetical protein
VLEIVLLGESASAQGSSLRSMCILLSIEIISRYWFRDFVALWDFGFALGSEFSALNEPVFVISNRFAFPRSARAVWFGAACL